MRCIACNTRLEPEDLLLSEEYCKSCYAYGEEEFEEDNNIDPDLDLEDDHE